MRTSLFRLSLAPLLSFGLALGSLSGCAAVAVAGAAVIVSQDVLDNNVYVATLDCDVDRVWTSTKVALNHASLKPIDVQDDVRHATADVDDAKVTVSVETYDFNRSTLRVSAKKYGVNNGQIAKMVYDKILHEIEQ